MVTPAAVVRVTPAAAAAPAAKVAAPVGRPAAAAAAAPVEVCMCHQQHASSLPSLHVVLMPSWLCLVAYVTNADAEVIESESILFDIAMHALMFLFQGNARVVCRAGRQHGCSKRLLGIVSCILACPQL